MSCFPQHYNMVMAAAAAASASDDHELLLNRFLPYTTSSSVPSQMYLSQSGATSVPSLATPTNGVSNSSNGNHHHSNHHHGNLVSANHLRDTHPNSHSNSSHISSHLSSHPGVLANHAGNDAAAVAAIYGGIRDVISLDWLRKIKRQWLDFLQGKTFSSQNSELGERLPIRALKMGSSEESKTSLKVDLNLSTGTNLAQM